MGDAQLAREVLDGVLHRAVEENMARVAVVRGWLAENEAVSLEHLQQQFTDSARGTAAEGAILELWVVKVPAVCNACDHAYTPTSSPLVCPHCHSRDGRLAGTPGLIIEELAAA